MPFYLIFDVELNGVRKVCACVISEEILRSVEFISIFH